MESELLIGNRLFTIFDFSLPIYSCLPCAFIASSSRTNFVIPFSVRKMAEDALLQMYEAQAIAIEQRAEADRLRGENEELTERLGRLQRKREGEKLLKCRFKPRCFTESTF